MIVDDSLIQVNGLFRHGFLIAPVVLEQVLCVVNNKVNGKNQTLPYDHLLAVQMLSKQGTAERERSSQPNKKEAIS